MRLEKARAKDYRRIKKLYKEAFPRSERVSFLVIKLRVRQGRVQLWNLVDDGKWTGFCCTIQAEGIVYIFYFAIDAALRGKGYGTKALKAILEHYKGDRVFLALEDWRESADNAEQRIKRHNFYLHCGLEDLPYKIKEDSVVYSIMGVGGKVEPEEYKELINKYLGAILKRFVDMRIIK